MIVLCGFDDALYSKKAFPIFKIKLYATNSNNYRNAKNSFLRNGQTFLKKL
jgi:hypothetical protein